MNQQQRRLPIGIAEHHQSTDTLLPARTVDGMHGDEKSNRELMILILREQRGLEREQKKKKNQTFKRWIKKGGGRKE